METTVLQRPCSISLLVLSIALVFAGTASAQKARSTYSDSINAYLRHYVSTHEVVTGKDRQHLHFFAPDSSYRVTAAFERTEDKDGFQMPSSLSNKRRFFRYGLLRFTLNGVDCRLTVFQSKDLMSSAGYRNYLFLPFTDSTNGTDTYEGGRYIDLSSTDIRNGSVTIDFNKAYNPYCSYTVGYDCPIPPRENALPVAVRAGEKKYTKPVH